jgi:hypothetical protein
VRQSRTSDGFGSIFPFLKGVPHCEFGPHAVSSKRPGNGRKVRKLVHWSVLLGEARVTHPRCVLQVTISYIDETEDYEIRQSALEDYDFVCQCPRCMDDLNSQG